MEQLPILQNNTLLSCFSTSLLTILNYFGGPKQNHDGSGVKVKGLGFGISEFTFQPSGIKVQVSDLWFKEFETLPWSFHT